jgi:DNA-directed RNA polymerase subunit RPC12/RpoP
MKKRKKCPRCSGPLLRDAQDGDLACLHCGNRIAVKPTKPLSRLTETGRKRRNPVHDGQRI